MRDRRETPHSTPARVRSVAQKAHPIARNVVGKNVGAKKANESSGNTPRFSSQRVLLTRRLRARDFLSRSAVQIDGSRFRAFEPTFALRRCQLENGFDDVRAIFRQRTDTRYASTMVVGELLFTGMTDWKQVGRGKTTVRVSAASVSSASRARRDRVPIPSSSD